MASSRDTGGSPTQPSRDRPQRLPTGHAAGDLLAFLQRQPQRRPCRRWLGQPLQPSDLAADRPPRPGKFTLQQPSRRPHLEQLTQPCRLSLRPPIHHTPPDPIEHRSTVLLRRPPETKAVSGHLARGGITRYGARGPSAPGVRADGATEPLQIGAVGRAREKSAVEVRRPLAGVGGGRLQNTPDRHDPPWIPDTGRVCSTRPGVRSTVL
jgi:hypothetical protein